MKPLVVSFVSGKGGVGKTMLAVAFARQLSKKGKTLLLDLDYFNRGLTGLLREGREVRALKPRDCLSQKEPGVMKSPGNWLR